METVFGPVPSRRLGRSIGINNIPPKVCSYSCVYCQLGRALNMQCNRSKFYDPQQILRDVTAKLDEVRRSGASVDYLTFVPDGEPTLDVNLGEAIAEVKKFGIPVALISNSSLMDQPKLRTELMMLDWISLKIDSVREATWRRLDRPHKNIDFSSMLEGIVRFSEDFAGKLTTETMLIADYNDSNEEIEAIGEFLERIEPQISYISIPTRPPAEKQAVPADEVALAKAYSNFAARVAHVEHLIGYEGNEFGFSGDAYQDILSISAVHPMRREAVLQLLDKDQADYRVVEQLIQEGRIISTEYQGHTYFVRKFREKQMG
ncbi:MAG: radical SAM protein [Spirochaetota bacterium]